MRIAIDAMGGDNAPETVVEGALIAAKIYDDTEYVLVGNKDRVRAELEKHGPVPDSIQIVHAGSSIKMDDSPVEALKQKRDSSITVAVQLVKSGEADALVAAGNTGAVVASTMMNLNLLDGVRRAGIAAPIPTPRRISYLADVGANVNCKPEHLVQYGAMAAAFVRATGLAENPSIGLLSVGKEGQKGNELVKEAYRLFKETNLNFKGNMEGTSLFHGDMDVVICEGFVGNVIIKFFESSGDNILEFINTIAREKDPDGRHLDFLKSVTDELANRLNYSSYGGAPLLGVNGICIIGHGRSDARAISNAIGVARKCVKHDVNKSIQHEIHLLLEKTTHVS